MPIERINKKQLFIDKNNPYLDQEIREELAACIVRLKKLIPSREPCPRCEMKSKVDGQFPYCMECNWDSLKDPGWQGSRMGVSQKKIIHSNKQ